MRELVLVVPRKAVEDVLDRLLPIVPQGVREVERGRQTELVMRGDDLPAVSELKLAVGRWPHRVIERHVSDEWRERRAADYVPDVVGGRLVVRPVWAPVGGHSHGDLIEIVLTESLAFGGGAHPTTRTCLELLLNLRPSGSFADLGCGSGVLAILAARLGWRPVTALDIDPGSVAAARRHAELNGVEIDARVGDLAAEPPPTANAFAANIPASVHAALARAWTGEPPRLGLLSGFGPGEASEVVEAYGAGGMRQSRRVDAHGWTVLIVEG